jgi:lipoyl(octanoyl) transferase
MSSLPASRSSTSAALEVRLLGAVDFDAALALQEWLTYELGDSRSDRGVLLLCEHPPLITIGREGTRRDVLASDVDLDACEMPVRWIGRGGGTVVHAPGQLAIYPLFSLRQRSLTPGEFRRRMEAALVSVCHELRVPAKRCDAGRGLWSRGGQVGHFGGTVKSGVTMHGAWLNVAVEPGFLRMIRCEREPSAEFGSRAPEHRVTSLQAQLLRRIPMSAAREATIRHIAAALDYDAVHTHTGHPQLTRTRQRVCVSTH